MNGLYKRLHILELNAYGNDKYEVYFTLDGYFLCEQYNTRKSAINEAPVVTIHIGTYW